MSVYASAQELSYPEGTVLGLSIDEIPNLPECTEQDIKAGQTDTRCMSKFIVGDRNWEMTIVLIPEQENNLPFLVDMIAYAKTPYLTLGLSIHEDADFNTVMNYLRTNYGDFIDYKKLGQTEVYEFQSGNMKIEFRNVNNSSENAMTIGFSSL